MQVASQSNPVWLQLIRQQVESIQCGVVQIVIHESKIVQIERTDKVRLSETLAKVPARPSPTSPLAE